jgi:hypothetical protein
MKHLAVKRAGNVKVCRGKHEWKYANSQLMLDYPIPEHPPCLVMHKTCITSAKSKPEGKNNCMERSITFCSSSGFQSIYSSCSHLSSLQLQSIPYRTLSRLRSARLLFTDLTGYQSKGCVFLYTQAIDLCNFA